MPREGVVVILIENCLNCGGADFDEDDCCEHCGDHRVPTCRSCDGEVDLEDDDQHCKSCGLSQLMCEGCGGFGAETCIACDVDWCLDCWNCEEHVCDRAIQVV